MFAYCNNTPTNGSDPSGHFFIELLREWIYGTGQEVAMADGPAPVGDAVFVIGLGALGLFSLLELGYNAISSSGGSTTIDGIAGASAVVPKSETNTSPHSKSTSSASVKSIAGSTPASPPDPNGNGEKHSYQKIGKNSFANKIAQKFGYENAEEFKDSIVGQGNGGRFNIGYDKVSKEVVLIRIQGNDVIPTGYFLEFPIY